MIEIGKVNVLIVEKECEDGFYLRDKEGTDEVLIKRELAPIVIEINKEIKVFVYTNPEGDVVATSSIPFAEVDEFALLDVVDVQDFGAFFDYGIEKDLLVPGNQQKVKVRSDESHVVRICLEEETGRLYGTTKLGVFIQEDDKDIIEGEKIEMVIARKGDLGYRVIVNKKFIGMIYDNEIFKNIVIGSSYDGYVKKIREDGLIDCALQIQGVKNLAVAKEKVLEMLRECGGKSVLNDKSPPQTIKNILDMSKQTFKKAIGMLYKDRLIQINKDGIQLINKK